MANIFSDILTGVNNGLIIDAGQVSGNLLVATSVVDLTSEPAQDDVIMYCDIPSNAKIKKLIFYNDDLDSGDAVKTNIGVYASAKISLSDGTIIEENDRVSISAFGFDEDGFQDSNNLGEDFRFNRTSNSFLAFGGFSNSNLALWELSDVSDLGGDPFKYLRIGIEIEVAFGTFIPGKSMLQVTYSGKI